jgi:hypothetical protein
MVNELIKKAKETHGLPDRSSLHIWKFKSNNFQAPLTMSLFPKLHFQHSQPILYGVVDRDDTDNVTWEVKYIPIELKDRQTITVPKTSFLIQMFVVKRKEDLPEFGAVSAEKEAKATSDPFADDEEDDDEDEGDADDSVEEQIFLLVVAPQSASDDTSIEIIIHGTGHAMYDLPVHYLNTIYFQNGKFVHHVFYSK